MSIFRKKIKIGLALGSGGPRGLAHIGIIKALENNEIPIDCIAGSSAGSIIGGLYSALKDIKKIEDIALSANRRTLLSLFFDPSLTQGLIAGNKLERFIEKYIGNINFSDLKIPFTAVATDLITKEPVPIKKGKVVKALRASSSIPFVLKPVKKGRHVLVDGGLSDPVPVDVVRKMGADLVIAVNLDYYLPNTSGKFGFYNIVSNSISIYAYNLSKNIIKRADFVIPAKVENVDLSTIVYKSKRAQIIDENEKLMIKLIPKIKKLIDKKSKVSWTKFFDIFKLKK